MSTVNKKEVTGTPVTSITWKRLWAFLKTEQGRTVFALAFVSGLFAAVYKAADNAMMNRYITRTDDLTAASTYLIIGGWVGVLTRILYSFLFGRRYIDGDYHGLSRGSRRMHQYALLAGALAALGTLATLKGNQGADPGVLIALSSFQIVFMGRWDRQKGQHLQGTVTPYILVVLFGCIMASFEGSWNFPWWTLLLVLLVSSPINAYSSHFGQEGARAGDSISYSFWRFFWLAAVGTVGVTLVALVRGKGDLLWASVNEALASPAVWVVVVVTMFFVFFNDTLETRAKKEAGASLAYVFLIALAAQIALGNPVTIIGEWMSPGIFGGRPDGAVVWIVRSIGLLLVGVGIFHLRGKNSATAK